ncbi:rab-GTPase-TBC domain-containing protein, partial [Tribonema minus]
MNFVALFLLRTARGREDVSFWLLRALACDVAPRYWEGTTSMARLRADLGVLRGLACARMPPLVKRLDDTGLPLELLACDWMLSLFCRVLPPRTVLRVWDWLLLEGADVLVFVALAVLRFAEEDVLQV